MRKKLIILTVLIIVFVAGTYLFIPKNLHVSQAEYLSIPQRAVIRAFNDVEKMKAWLPAGSELGGNKIIYNGLQFAIATLDETAIQKSVITSSKGDTINSHISSNLLPNDSSFIYWECDLTSSLSPVNRILQYNKAAKIKRSIDALLSAFHQYTISQKNIYDIKIERIKTKDSVLISERKAFTNTPGVVQAYDMINSLRKYSSDQGANETGFPMINIIALDSTDLSMMAAIPINKTIPESGNKKIKRLLYDGNFLVSEVKGGPGLIKDALQKMENYKEDYKLQSPAMPYQSLITDRTKTKDTAQWVTKIYYPVY